MGLTEPKRSVTVKASVVEAEAKPVRPYKKSFPSTPKYLRLVTRFMEAGGDQLTKRIRVVYQSRASLSFCQPSIKTSTSEVPITAHPPSVVDPSTVDFEEATGQ
ncbi:hypothetical protein Adt_31083 [Abeliophyllum distichum]|uniref:Uncharacterized protein n=1 Tax=Abeliophyllum distichum TaxID=126358 RepID=A0ABD1RD34_9LAMI